MRRLPVYLILDCSGSMSGVPIQQVDDGVQKLVTALRQDPHALETAYLSVITFETSASVAVPLTDLASFQPPSLTAGGITAMGEALTLTAKQAASEVKLSTADQKGDWKPIVFVMTDGLPTDDFEKGLSEFQKYKWGVVVGCSVNDGAPDVLKKVAGENVVQLNTADSNAMSAFFKWVTASVSAASKSVEEAGKDLSEMDQLPPPPPEIQVVA